jgi:hypothetical protein
MEKMTDFEKIQRTWTKGRILASRSQTPIRLPARIRGEVTLQGTQRKRSSKNIEKTTIKREVLFILILNTSRYPCLSNVELPLSGIAAH